MMTVGGDQRLLIASATQEASVCEYELTSVPGQLDGSMAVVAKRRWMMRMPERMLAMLPFQLKSRNIDGYLVSMADGRLRIYQGRQLVIEAYCEEPLCSASFGRYKEEDYVLLGVTVNGGFVAKALKRSATELETKEISCGPPPEQDYPLPVPSKTRLYLQQRAREQKEPRDIHKRFQRDLQLLRLQVAKTFKNSIAKALNPVSDARETDENPIQLKMTTELYGLGPQFDIRLVLEPLGQPESPISGVYIVSSFQKQTDEASVYPRVLRAPVMVSGYQYKLQITVKLQKSSNKDANVVATTNPCTCIVKAVCGDRVLVVNAIEIPAVVLL